MRHLKKIVKPMVVKLRSKMSHWPEIPRRFVLYFTCFRFWGYQTSENCNQIFLWDFFAGENFSLPYFRFDICEKTEKSTFVFWRFFHLFQLTFFSAYSTKLVSVKNLKMSLHLLPFCLRTFLLQVVLSSNVKPLHLFCQPHLWSCPIWSQLFLKRILRNFWIHCQRYALVLNP